MRVGLAVALGAHLLLGLLFLHVGVMGLVGLHAGAALLHAVAQQQLARRHHAAALGLGWTAVVGHAGLASWLLGWGSGGHYLLLGVMPTFFLAPLRPRAKLALGLLLAGLALGLQALLRHATPPLPLPPAVLDALPALHIAITFAVLAAVAQACFGAITRAERELHRLATTDALTGLCNRRWLLEQLAPLCEAPPPQRRTDAPPLRPVLSLLLIDLDRFRSVNEAHGDAAGDAVLREIARRLQHRLQADHRVARWAGSAFLVALPGTPLVEALAIAERLRRLVGLPLALPDSGADLEVSATTGVATLRGDETLIEALARADAALSRGKQEGGNRVQADDEVPRPMPGARPSRPQLQVVPKAKSAVTSA